VAIFRFQKIIPGKLLSTSTVKLFGLAIRESSTLRPKCSSRSGPLRVALRWKRPSASGRHAKGGSPNFALAKVRCPETDGAVDHAQRAGEQVHQRVRIHGPLLAARRSRSERASIRIRMAAAVAS
jgi:hypothetical protein